MVWFIFFAACSASIVGILLLISSDGRLKQPTSPFIKISVGVKQYIYAVLVLILYTWLLVIAIARLARPNIWVHAWYDYFNDYWFAQSLMGVAFGAVLALWLRKIYLLAPDDNLSLQQKIEGVALILLFIVGTSSTPLSELIRGLSVKGGALEVSFADTKGGLVAPLSESNNSTWSAGSLKVSDSCPVEDRAKCANSEVGLGAFGELGTRMQLDGMRITQDWDSSATASIEQRTNLSQREADIAGSLRRSGGRYRRSIEVFASCLQWLNLTTNDEQYARVLLLRLKIPLKEMHFLAIHKKPKILFYNTYKKFAFEMNAISKDAFSHAVIVSMEVNQCQNIKQHYTVEQLESIFASNPEYLSILYASVLQLEHNEIEAVSVMQSWLNQGDLPEWSVFRIITTKHLLFESLFRREPSQRPATIKDHLENTANLINFLKSKMRIAKYYNEIFVNDKNDIVNGNFEGENDYRITCPDGTSDDDFGFSFALLTYEGTYVLRALDHPRYADLYFDTAKQFVDHIAKADYGCVKRRIQKHLFSNEQYEFARAENFRIFALYTLTLNDSRQKNQKSSGAISELTQALGALRRCKQIADTTPAAFPPDYGDQLDSAISGIESTINHSAI